MKKRIIVIKLGALGDVVRTLPILPAFKEKYPDSEIYWVTKQNALQIIKGNPYVARALSLPYNSEENFDLLYNFDIEKEATMLAQNIKANKKYGFCSEGDYPAAFNFNSEYYLNTLFDDEIKKSNKKTYQEMMFDAAELPYKRQHCMIYLNDKDKEYAKNFVKSNSVKTEKLIGIHIGSAPRWPSKAWSEEKVKEFIKKAKRNGYEILLFGGPDEIDKHRKFILDLKQERIDVYQNNPHNTILEFTSLVNICKKIICSDSLALHVSLALKKPTIVLFFCTPPDEIENYGVLTKIVSPLLYDFFPEKMDQYSETLVNSISSDEVLNAVINN